MSNNTGPQSCDPLNRDGWRPRHDRCIHRARWIALSVVLAALPIGCQRNAAPPAPAAASNAALAALEAKGVSVRRSDSAGSIGTLVGITLDASATGFTPSDYVLLTDIQVDAVELTVDGFPATNSVLPWVKGIRNLRTLTLVAYQNPAPDFSIMGTIPQLENLWVVCDSISAESLAALARQPQLRHLDLVGAELGAEALQSINTIGTVENLGLWNCKISSEGLQDIRPFVGLKRLLIWTNEISLELMNAVVRCEELEWLELQGALPPGASAMLSNMTGLKSLSIAETPLAKEDVAEIVKLTNLERLWLTAAGLPDDTVGEIVTLPSLYELNLSDNPLTDACVPALCTLKQLSDLWLFGTKITQRGIDDIRQAFPTADYDSDMIKFTRPVWFGYDENGEVVRRLVE
ncbi:MAG: hypothetical protein KDA44_23650 [Planctomycetales bacterium]|nr:hypothetical protein [Planctomycetales bacterium]